ncbi:glutamine--fructose-6-phosphate aminotransferase [Chromatiales bacterium (ex Bugula neritina AB1)]|nr:glutamine--fructose-6-phosphate aminotransferase [Chromatiales bacterium (ex Bugula neritina AB1)]
MCGIIAAYAQRNVTPILLEGLHRMEYRGYDSAGISVLDKDYKINRTRALGKVAVLGGKLEKSPMDSGIGIAHTRWATHGEPSEANAHPHNSSNQFSVVHNGIIENHEALRSELQTGGYEFTSQTDTEVIVHLLHREVERAGDYLAGMKNTVAQLDGAYAIAVLNTAMPDRLLAVRKGSPLLVGLGVGEFFLASDTAALIPVTQEFIYLEDGDLVDICEGKLHIQDESGVEVKRPIKTSTLSLGSVDKGPYKHFMLKEIYEQPNAVRATLQDRITDKQLLLNGFGDLDINVLRHAEAIHIVACGTSYHAGLTAKYWFEEYTDTPCSVEIASEYRYRSVAVPKNTLYITLSQSGETADSLAALEEVKKSGKYLGTLAICNVPESTLTREADATLLTKAGPEIGVASTKAFTTQLVALQLVALTLSKAKETLTDDQRSEVIRALYESPITMERLLGLDRTIEHLAEEFVEKDHAIFLGRGSMYPIALEGALKLKEISYIHAEGYPAGELKHGPLALVDNEVPVVAIAPNDSLLEKLKSNLEEVRTRGGQLYVMTEENTDIAPVDGLTLVKIPGCPEAVAPLLLTVPLQLLSYHVAVMRGTDVDQPRNLAKSVTVE